MDEGGEEGEMEKRRRGPKQGEDQEGSGQVVNDGFLAGLFRPILHKIITLLHPPRFLFRLSYISPCFHFPSSRFINI